MRSTPPRRHRRCGLLLLCALAALSLSHGMATNDDSTPWDTGGHGRAEGSGGAAGGVAAGPWDDGGTPSQDPGGPVDDGSPSRVLEPTGSATCSVSLTGWPPSASTFSMLCEGAMVTVDCGLPFRNRAVPVPRGE